MENVQVLLGFTRQGLGHGSLREAEDAGSGEGAWGQEQRGKLESLSPS